MGEPDPDAVDYYSRIGAPPDADADTIERRRKQADRRFSPMSTSPEGSEQHHMKVNAASSVLEDADERARYDLCYDTFGRVRGTAVYDTLGASPLDAVREDDVLADHLRGFVEVLGPVAGARAFGDYLDELDPPLPDEISTASLPNGYAVEDAGFGIAAWSFHRADQPCAFALWLTGGRDLWRSALQDPGDVDAMVADLEASGPPDPAEISASVADDGDDDSTPTTRISGHPRSGGNATSPDGLPSEYQPDSDDTSPTTQTDTSPTEPSPTDSPSRLAVPVRRLRDVVRYLLGTGGWGIASLSAASLTGVAAVMVVAAVFVPLVALSLLVVSVAPSVSTTLQSSAGVPLVDTGAPFVTAGAVHYIALVLLAVLPIALSVRWVVPRVHDRREQGLPRDAWLVFLTVLGTLAAALLVGLRGGTLPRSAGVATAVLVTAGAFQASLDVGAPRLLSLLCRRVAAVAFGLVSSAVAVLATGVVLDAIAPSVSSTYTALVTGLPFVSSPLAALDNAELFALGFAALALVPLVLTTLYSLTYALESVALRLRSGSYS